MSALKPEVGDRFSFGSSAWQVDTLGVLSKLSNRHAIAKDHRQGARLRDAEWPTRTRVVALDKLMFDYVYLGNFLPPAGWTLHKCGGSFYARSPAGNVYGPEAGRRWDEALALEAARRFAGVSTTGRAGQGAQAATGGGSAG